MSQDRVETTPLERNTRCSQGTVASSAQARMEQDTTAEQSIILETSLSDDSQSDISSDVSDQVLRNRANSITQRTQPAPQLALDAGRHRNYMNRLLAACSATDVVKSMPQTFATIILPFALVIILILPIFAITISILISAAVESMNLACYLPGIGDLCRWGCHSNSLFILLTFSKTCSRYRAPYTPTLEPGFFLGVKADAKIIDDITQSLDEYRLRCMGNEIKARRVPPAFMTPDQDKILQDQGKVCSKTSPRAAFSNDVCPHR